MTSNAGARNIVENKSIGFIASQDENRDYEKAKSEVMAELKKLFRPEFLNRLDEIVVFRKLSNESIEKIVRLMLKDFEKLVNDKNINVEITDEVVKYIAKIGFDENYGARPLRRAIQSNIEDKFAECILDSKIKEKDKVIIDYKDNEIIIHTKK